MAASPSPDQRHVQAGIILSAEDPNVTGGALPTPLTSFIGRTRELAEVCALLRGETRLLTLTGPGGVGKTRLAVRVAAELSPDFPDGVTFVRLASINDPALVLPIIARTWGVQETSAPSLIDRVGALLRDRHVLLVLDNLEHLVDAASGLAALLAACPGVKLLATSRAVLRISGEQVYPAPPLAVPDLARSNELSEATAAEAVALFAQRARAADPHFVLTNEDAPTVIEICRRLDGLPLAIELAAARVSVLPVSALLSRLEHRLAILTGGARDLPPRQQTMRRAIAWSDDLLPEGEKRLFRRLSLFSGGFTVDSAAAVTTFGDDASLVSSRQTGADVFDLLASLVEKSLLRPATSPPGLPNHRQPCFEMLETIREYAWDQLAASGEAEAGRRHHASHFIRLAKYIWQSFWHGPPERWWDRLASEHENFRAAFAWSIERAEVDMALRLAGALEPLWWALGYHSEGRRWLDRALSESNGLPTLPLVRALVVSSRLAIFQGDIESAKQRAEDALASARAIGDQEGIADALFQLAFVALQQNEVERATALELDALARFRQIRHRAKAAFTLRHLADFDDQSLAQERLEEALALFREIGHTHGAAATLTTFGRILLDRGEPAPAFDLFRESLRLRVEMGDRWGLPFCLEGLAEVSRLNGQPDKAARLYGAADILHETIGLAVVNEHRTRYERNVARVRTAMSAAAFVQAWAAGRAMPLHQAIEEALSVALVPAGSRALDAERHALSHREVEVMRLVADGLSDQAIADGLYIGRGTVRTHLNHIYDKLDVRSRTAAVAAARRLGIV